MRYRLAAALALLALVLGVTVPAQGATTAPPPTVNPDLVATMVSSTTTEITVTQAAALGAVQPAQLDRLATQTSAHCWNQYEYWAWTFAFGRIGFSWMQLVWCSNGSTITSWSVPLRGAKGTNGFGGEWVDQGGRSVGWEVREYEEYHFWVTALNLYGCMQIRGGATGLYSTQRSCDLS